MRYKALSVFAMLIAPMQVQAATVFRADLAQVNFSGVSGFINFVLDGNMLNVDLEAAGLADGVHFLHIHGLDSASGAPIDTAAPPPPAPPNGDIDGNGVVVTGETKAAIGGVILSLAPHTPGVSGELVGVNSTGGTLSFRGSYDLTQNIYEPGYSMTDLLPLDFRVFDLHGGIVPAGIVFNGSTTAPGSYDPNLPVAAGAIAAVPEPATWAMMIGGVGMVGGMMRRRRATNVRVTYA